MTRSVFRFLLLCLPVLPLAAHMVSISTGELRVDGSVARYELRMPLYEVEQMENPQETLFQRFRLLSAGQEGRPARIACREIPAEDTFYCEAEYRFPEPVERLDIECTYYTVTIPNHVHILQAWRGETADQAVFDFTAPWAEMNFVPPTLWEVLTEQTGAGMKRAAGGVASLLFLFALALAARQRRELIALTGMFVAGEVLAVTVLPLMGWQPAPRFVEAAAALTTAYLAVEILLLPKAGQRWLVVGVLGLFHGLYLALFLGGTGYSAGYVLLGAAVADAAGIGLSALVLSGIRRVFGAVPTARVLAALLLAFGLGWFWMRLRG